jgi:glutamine amidotransferase
VTLAILDLGYGNTDSIRLAFARLGVEADLIRTAAEVEATERLVLPGVGAAGFAMDRLSDAGLVEPLRRRTKPLLGICLGMQMLFDASDEGETSLLGMIPGRVRSLVPAPGQPKKPTPRLGWRLATMSISRMALPATTAPRQQQASLTAAKSRRRSNKAISGVRNFILSAPRERARPF